MTISISLNAGLDVGNGYLKGVAENTATGVRDVIDMPSAVAVLTRPNPLPTADHDASSVLDADFFNQLDATFNTPLVPDLYRRVFGVRSLSADGALQEFDTVGRASKARQPLSKALVLGVLAAKALRDVVTSTGALPAEEIQITARIALALPITEYVRHRESYAAEFLHGGSAHLVTIENFDTKVSIRITFADVQVFPEGASAQYAITSKGTPLMEAMLKDVRARSQAQKTALEGITATDVLAATHSIGIDVGEGTVNFAVFSHGKFNVEASQTFDKGYGSVLLGAIKSMEDQGVESGFTSRKELADFLQNEPSPLKRAFYTRVQQFVDQEAQFFATEVAERLGAVLRAVGAVTEVGYVYGGGSGAIKDALYPALLAKVSEMNSISAFPVLYLDASYSRNLNREGLFIAVEAMAKRASQASQPAAQAKPAKKNSTGNTNASVEEGAAA